jgi:phosphatidylethanolamine/phosphatidyl-N-methylethanolamine N-methyltransferase
LANNIGWHSDFEIGTILKEKRLSKEEQRPLPPLGMMTFLVLEKSASD